MAKLIAVFAVAVTLMAAAFASAAGMNVTGGVVQAGSDNNLTCQANQLQVDSWQLFGLGAGQQYVETVTVKNIDKGCVGDRLMFSVNTTGGTYASWSVPDNFDFHTITSSDIGNTVQFYFADPSNLASHDIHLDPASITGIQFFIEGTNK